MMNWLTPLGFLGLIGIAVLILIYILKPNYQQKFISSTYIWKLSLKYKKKKIPINKLRNILLIICQILVITSCAFILAQPIIEESQAPLVIDRVAIIDASASMRAADNDESRFDRAVFKATALANQTFEEGGYFTVIFAGYEATYITQRATADEAFDVQAQLAELVDNETYACTWGEADIQGAIELAQRIVDQNVDAEVYLYTGTEYLDDGGNVIIEDCTMTGEWNVAILDCQPVLEDNYYTFKITVASYGADTNLFVFCNVYGANGVESNKVALEAQVVCNSDQTRTVSIVTSSFQGEKAKDKIYEYDYIHVYLNEADSIAQDNSFFVYGGVKPELNTLYYNPKANDFVSGVMLTARTSLSKNWSVTHKEINTIKEKEIPVEGYDFYLYEGTMPDTLPTDGVVMLMNMDRSPDGLTVVMGEESPPTTKENPYIPRIAESHPIMNYIDPANIKITKYRTLVNYEGFKPLMYVGNDPVLLVKETDGQKIVIMNFSVNYSDLAVRVEFPILMYNILQHFLPATLDKSAFEVNEVIELNSRSDKLSVVSIDDKYKNEFTQFPTEITLTLPGSYTVSQTPISGVQQVEQFFVKMPSSESNIFRVEDTLYELIVPKKKATDNLDLLVYFAAALVALILIERILQAQEG